MTKFEKLIEQAYTRLGVVTEADDDPEADNEEQKKAVADAAAETDTAEDNAHEAQKKEHEARQTAASAQTTSSTTKAQAATAKTQKLNQGG
tara:strand:- start:81 stop:353 length:273 start_codon:yes stop_codon:yes gene_type:complete